MKSRARATPFAAGARLTIRFEMRPPVTAAHDTGAARGTMWRVLKKLSKAAGALLLLLIASAVVLYLAGARIVLDGGGSPHVRFGESAAKQAEIIARHCEAQRQRPPAPPPAP